MARYYVTRKEIHDAIIAIDAKDAKDALYRVNNGEGEEVHTEYSRTLDPDTWFVEEAPND